MIHDVKIIDVKTNTDERGYFRELIRFQEDFNGISIGQISHSKVKKGIIKGWHGHLYQSQWNYVVTGQIKVCLYDNRKDSESYKKTMQFVLGDGSENFVYYFPPGVLHGYECTKGPMHIIYLTSGTYDLKDEIRVSLDKIETNIWK